MMSTSAHRKKARPILEVDGVSKHFGALAAVDGLSFEVEEGQVFGIAGPNGAGKTALFDVVTGLSRASSGAVRFRGREIQASTANAICQLGIARTFQIPAMFPSQTVLGTILAAAHFGQKMRRVGTFRFCKSDIDASYAAAEVVGLSEDQLECKTESLSQFDLKRLMLAAAVATSPSVILLDEPVGGLTEAEADQFVQYVDGVRQQGVTIIVIEHVMKVLMSISDRVLIMNQGKRVMEGTPSDVVRDPEVVRIYLGETLAAALAAREVGEHAGN